MNGEDCFVLFSFSMCFFLSLAIKLVSAFLLLLKEAVWIILATQRLIIPIVTGGPSGKT